MKPLQILSAAGNSAIGVIDALANIANKAFKDLNFHLVDTVLFFAPSIDRFIQRATEDPELCELMNIR